MKSLLLVTFTLCLSACTTSTISPYGQDTFLLTVADDLGTSQKAKLRARAAQEANAHCAGMGKQMTVGSAEDKGVAWLSSTSSQLVFSCK